MVTFHRHKGTDSQKILGKDLNGRVNDSDKLEGSTKAEVQDHNPKIHATNHEDGGADEVDINKVKVVKEAGEDLLEGQPVYLSLGGLATSKREENTTGSSDSVIYGTRHGGQTFSHDEEWTLTKVNLMLRKVNAPAGDVQVDIYATLAGKPTGASLGSKTVLASTLGAAYALIEFEFATPIDLDANTTYVPVCKATSADSTNRVEWQYANSGNPYANGTFVYSSDSGTNWAIESTFDFRFDAYGYERAGRVYKTDASFDDERTTQYLGFADAAATAGNNVNINIAGKQTGLTGLTAGSDYYLSDTEGEISTSAGTNKITVGRAISTTELLLYILGELTPVEETTVVSDTNSWPNDAEKSSDSLTYVKIKEILLNEDLSVVRIYFQHKATSSGPIGYAKIYKNGVAIGTERSQAGSAWISYNEDFANLVNGDLIQIYVKSTLAGYGSFIKSFQLHFDRKVNKLNNVALSTLVLFTPFDTNPTNQDP